MSQGPERDETMDYNRFVERVRKMYPNGRENSFDIEAKVECKKDDNADGEKNTSDVKEADSKGENLCG